MSTHAGRWLPSRLGLVSFGVILAVAAIEVMARLVGYVLPDLMALQHRFYSARRAWETMTIGDPYIGYRFKPHLDMLFPSEEGPIHIRTNDFGLGDIGFRDIGTQPPFRAVAIGDSFTFCDDVPVEGCWVRLLADAMGISIADLGVSGYSNLAEARVLERYGRQLKPDLIVAGVYPNDFKDNVAFDSWAQTGNDWFRREGPGTLNHWLVDHSVAMRTMDTAFRPRSHEKIFKYDHDNMHLMFHFEHWWVELVDGHARPGLPLVQKALLDMRATATAIGAKFVVLLFPTKEQVYWDLARHYVRDLENVDVDQPLELIGGFCDAQAIKHCDLTSALRDEARQGRQLYLRISGHWNEKGNAVVAAAVARCLSTDG